MILIALSPPSPILFLPPSSLSHVDLLETSPFLYLTLPWGELSALSHLDRSRSDDGPIVWARPGEQLIPTADNGTPRKKKM